MADGGWRMADGGWRMAPATRHYASSALMNSLPTDIDLPPGADMRELVDPFAIAGQWFVLHTKSRQEKAVAELLGTLRIACFLPLQGHVRFYGKRKKQVSLPLFPGYVFLRGEVEQAYTADRSKRIAGIITVADQDRLTWELRNLQFALTAQAPLDPYPYLRAGIRAEVRAGPLKGLQGLIESRTRRDRLLLQVDLLGRAVSVEVDGSLLEPLE
jgi:transcription termination/antitermination protein NusG